ncbi:hypothetical protein [Acidovorax sp. LjRoot117]|uniref:hypothetical protein n=1 Tax=Acidovorax sp. LjRoot117 TaxID=3342255 RepID=UPI003ECDF4EA
MSTLQAHRAAIVAALSSVPDIGVVHDRERYAKDNNAFASLFLHQPANGLKHLRGWTLRRTATREHSPNVRRTLNEHTWTLRGYMAFNDVDASELVIDDLVEQFRAVVRNDPTLGGVCQPGPLDDETDGVQVTDAGAVMFAGALCNSVVLQLKTWSYL